MYSVPTVHTDNEGTFRLVSFESILTARSSTPECDVASKEVSLAFDDMDALGLPAAPVAGESTPQLLQSPRYPLKFAILIAYIVENGPVEQLLTIQEGKYLVNVRQSGSIDIRHSIQTLLCYRERRSNLSQTTNGVQPASDATNSVLGGTESPVLLAFPHAGGNARRVKVNLIYSFFS